MEMLDFVPLIVFGGFIGELITTVGSLIGGERRNRSQEQMSERQMEFQERMSSTAYQRAMEDMRKAGLNPMLAYSQGGASSPPGSMPYIEDTITPAISTGLQTALNRATVSNLKEDTAKKVSETELNKATEGLVKQQEKAAANAVTISRLDAERKEHAGDSWTGNQIESLERILKRVWAELGPKVGSSAQDMSSVGKKATESVGDWLGRILDKLREGKSLVR